MKFYTQLLMTLLLAFALGACTSTEPSETAEAGDMAEGSTAEIADASAGDMATDDFGDFGDDFGDDFGSDAAATDDFGSDDAFADDFAADSTTTSSDPFAEEPATTDASSDFAVTDDTATTPSEDDPLLSEPVDDSLSDLGADDFAMSDDSSSAASDELTGLGEDTSFASDDSSFTDDTGFGSGFGSETSTEDTSSYIPLNKMLTTPYNKAGHLVNAMYVVREGDSFDSIAAKIYGDSGRSGELRDINTHLASRDMVVGDKIYYNSPQRPQDDSKILFYYEDIGLNPEIYVAQSGDSIRAVGKQLLGHPKSWKEIYATNMNIESKDILDEGVQIRYWSGDLGAPAPPVQAAVNTPPPVVEEPPMIEEPPIVEEPPALPDEPEIAGNDMAPPQEDLAQNEPAAVGAVDNNPPPPPKFQPPPPPPKVNAPPKPVAQNDAAGALGMGDDTTALMAGAILLIAAVLMVIIIRKKKAKKNIEFQTATHTHID